MKKATALLLIFLHFSSCPMSPSNEKLNAILKKPIAEIQKLYGPANNGVAEYIIGFKFEAGIGLPEKNTTYALKYFHKAAEKGHPASLYVIAHKYLNGENTEIDLEKAHEYIKKAAEAGYPLAQYHHGGIILEKDFNTGVNWIKKAAEKGYNEAFVNLGIHAIEGLDDFGKKNSPDYEKAFDFFKKAAEHHSFRGMYYLAQFYYLGLTGTKNKGKAKEIIDQVLNSTCEESYLVKGMIYENGIIVGKNLQKAKQYCESLLQISPGHQITKDLLASINDQIAEQIKTEQELLKEKDKILTSPFPKITVARIPYQEKTTEENSKTLPKEDIKQPLNEPIVSDFVEKDIIPLVAVQVATDDIIKELLNRIPCDDGSFIEEVDTKKGRIVIKNQFDSSKVTIIIDEPKTIPLNALTRFKRIAYEERVSNWFGEKEKLLAQHTQEEIDRHRFAQKVDEVVDLYGGEAVFAKENGTLQQNKIIPGYITTKNNHKLKGIFEYAYYQERAKEKILYHRFLHSHSKALPLDEKPNH